MLKRQIPSKHPIIIQFEVMRNKMFGGASYMTNLPRTAVQEKRQYLMDELLKLGVYKKEDKHLYELTLTDLEEEYRFIETNVFGSTGESYDHDIHQ